MKNVDPTRPALNAGFHLEQVCFERVFDAPASSGMFSFEAAGMRQYGVMLPGAPRPCAGACYAVVLAPPGNWQKVLGCRDLATPDVYLRETVWGEVIELAWTAYIVLPLVLVFTLLAFGGWAALAALGLLVWAGVAYLRHVQRRSRAIEALLRAVPPVAPPGTGRDPGPPWKRRLLRQLPWSIPWV